MIKLPIITIAIPAYNRPTELNSVLRGMRPLFDNNNIEFLVVDDGSTPELNLEDDVQHRNLTLVRNEENIGFFENFIKIVGLSRGKYIIYLNDDDFLINENIPSLLTFLSSSSASFISTKFYRNKALYRGKTKNKAIKASEFFESSAHSPGLIFRRSETSDNIIFLRSLSISKALKIYPQVLLLLIAIVRGQKTQWLNLEIAKEGYDRPTGQSPNNRGYWSPEERWAQFIAFSDIITQIEEKPRWYRNVRTVTKTLNKLGYKLLLVCYWTLKKRLHSGLFLQPELSEI